MSIIFKKFQRDLYSELPKIAVSIIIISMGIGGFITFFQVSDNIKETVDSQYDEMNLGDSWINLQPIPIPTPEELIEYSKQNDDNSINLNVSWLPVQRNIRCDNFNTYSRNNINFLPRFHC